MALDTTPGALTAESYVTTAEATTYTSVNGLAWAGDLAAQEAALRRATTWIDGTYRSRFSGQRQNGRAQALEWPRKDATDANGDEVEIDAIPSEIVRATIEAAVREMAEPNSLSPDVTLGTSKVLTEVGDLGWEVVRKPSGADDLRPTLTVVEGILSALIGAKANYKTLLRS